MSRYLLLITMLALSTFVYSQEERNNLAERPGFLFTGNELVVGQGLLPSGQVLPWFSNTRYQNNVVTGELFASYRHQFSRVVALGVTLGYEHEGGTWTHRNGYHAAYPLGVSGSFTRNRYTIAPEITFTYFNSPKGSVRLYGLASVGYTRQNQAITMEYTGSGSPAEIAAVPNPLVNRFSMHLSPLGVRFGRALGGFVEMGMGYKGLFNYGLNYRF